MPLAISHMGDVREGKLSFQNLSFDEPQIPRTIYVGHGFIRVWSQYNLPFILYLCTCAFQQLVGVFHGYLALITLFLNVILLLFGLKKILTES